MPDEVTSNSFRSNIIEDTSPTGSNEGKLTTRQWMEQVYRRVHQMASSQMSRETKDHTLSATALINEVFVRLQSQGQENLLDERQFLAIVASEMKRTLIDAARRKQSIKRGGGRNKLELDDGFAAENVVDSISNLDDAVEQFEKTDPVSAELVRLRYFLGLSEAEAAGMLGISRSTASRKWAFARAWLLNYISV